MTDWKQNLDKRTAILLRQAIKCQMEIGIGDILIDPKGVREKQEKLAKSGRKVRPKLHSSLEEHNKAICGCQKCPLGSTRTKFVYGVGNPNAGLMFIGEAPGRDEDIQGEPFVGRAGQLLDKILAAAGFKREEVYIANILKCRPPNNRDPQPDEMATCMPYLLEQIQLIRPKIICALGRISAQALLKTTTPIGKLRGQWHEFNGIPFFITYHPAALLRFPAYKRDVWEDIQKLRVRYDELVS